MEERILQLLEGLTDDVKTIKSDVSGLQEQIGQFETKMSHSLEQVNRILEGKNPQLKDQLYSLLHSQPDYRNDAGIVKPRIFDLESKLK